MFRKVALAVAMIVSTAAYTSANPLIFSQGTIQTGPLTTASNYFQINLDSGNGLQFINGYTPGGGTNVFGTTTHFTALGANRLATYLGNLVPTLSQPLYGGREVVAVFAVHGTSPSPAQIVLTHGTVGLFAVDPGSFIRENPSTWGASDGSGNYSTANLIASWTLFAGQNSQDSTTGPGIFNLNANQWNQASINLTVNAANQGFFLFEESSNPNFWNSGATDVINEGLGVRIDESLIGGQQSTTFTSFVPTSINLMNNIWTGLLGSNPSGFGFASGWGGVAAPGTASSTYSPQNAIANTQNNIPPNTSDSVFTLGGLGGFWYQQQVIPEPTTLGILAGALGIGGMVLRRRIKQPE
jgi:hypothetical protein